MYQLHLLEELIRPLEIIVDLKGVSSAQKMAFHINEEWTDVEEGIDTVKVYTERLNQAQKKLDNMQQINSTAFAHSEEQLPWQNMINQLAVSLLGIDGVLHTEYSLLQIKMSRQIELNNFYENQQKIPLNQLKVDVASKTDSAQGEMLVARRNIESMSSTFNVG